MLLFLVPLLCAFGFCSRILLLIIGGFRNSRAASFSKWFVDMVYEKKIQFWSVTPAGQTNSFTLRALWSRLAALDSISVKVYKIPIIAGYG